MSDAAASTAPIRAPIPANVLSGHLGAGKTSAIAWLLRHRPDGERWAVIVNEFGEIGVDGAALEPDADGLLLREVNGDCICCGMGAPLLFVLERLLDREPFDRLLIEPTGLAEPTAVIDSFGAPAIRDRLRRMAMITLMDMRAAARERVATHATPLRQVHAADILVGTFADEAETADVDAFTAFAATLDPAKALTAIVEHGRVEPAWLELEPVREAVHTHDHSHNAVTRGWLFPHADRFDRNAIDRLVRGIAADVMRAKGSLRTPYGWKRGDVDAAGTVRWRTVPDGRDSRFEVIAAGDANVDFSAIDAALQAARS